MPNYKVSIIVPSYKPQLYLWECLDKLNKQTALKQTFEVILLLNGPKQPYFAKIENFKLKYCFTNLRLLYCENKGVSNARNYGLQNSNSEYVIFLDDDDMLSENFIEKILEIAVTDSIVITNVKAFKERTPEVIISDPLGQYYQKLNRRKTKNFLKSAPFFSTVWGKLIPRKIIGNCLFNSGLEKGEDSLFMLSISNKIEKIIFADENVYYMRRVREESLSRKKRSYFWQLNNDIKLFKEHLFLFSLRQSRGLFLLYIFRLFRCFLNLISSFLGVKKKIDLKKFFRHC